MTNLELSKLIALARANPMFVRGKLGEEFLKGFESAEAIEAGQALIAWKTGKGRLVHAGARVALRLAGGHPGDPAS